MAATTEDVKNSIRNPSQRGTVRMGLILQVPETGQQPREQSREGRSFPATPPAPGNATAMGFRQRYTPARHLHPKTQATEPITTQVLYYH